MLKTTKTEEIMTFINTKLRKELIKAYTSYRDEKEASGGLSTRRVKDVDDIEKLVEGATSTEVLYETVKDRVYEICTGFWYFYTGRSELKSNFNKALNRLPLTELLKEDIASLQNLNSAKKTMNISEEQTQEGNSDPLLKKEIASLKEEVNDLKEKHAILVDVNRELRKEVDELQNIAETKSDASPITQESLSVGQ